MAIKKANATQKSSTPIFNTVEECGTISTRNNGWELKLRYGNWNGNEDKYDLRPWKEDENTGEERCLKGISLSGEELEALGKLILSMMEEKPKAKATRKPRAKKTTAA